MMKLYIPIAMIIIGASLPSNPVLAQSKFEIEHHIKAEDAPRKAVDMVNALPLRGKIKWYYEENLKGNSYEAKNKSDHHRYSIEFDTLGNFQDIEIDIRWNRMDTVVQSAISAELEQRFDFFKFRKIQIQYQDPTHVRDVIGKGPVRLAYPHRYEIVLEGKKDNFYQLYEVTFDQHGEWLKSYDILPGNSDVLEY
ncbi:MAG: PepSY-like domain-containing protein [Saprospiraceae bacterium]|nr:PepSY-like domain-containing protein [Saprospiraceae bacterium]